MRWRELEPGDIYTVGGWSYLVLTKPRVNKEWWEGSDDWPIVWGVLVLDTGATGEVGVMEDEHIYPDYELLVRER